MATVNGPYTHGNTYAQLGKTFEYLGAVIDEELTERLDLQASGLVVPLGVFGGTGTTTLRQRRAGGFGFGRRMTAVSSETGTGEVSGITASYTDTTIGRFHTADSESFLRAITQADGLTLDALAAKHVSSYVATVRYLTCVSFTGMTTSKGTSGAAADTDDVFALIAAYEETAGYSGEPVVNVLHPEQITDIRTSLRSYAGYQFPEPTERLQQLAGGGGGFGLAFRLLGMDFYRSHDVVSSGGDHVGGSYVVGKFGLACGDTSRIVPMDGTPAMVLSQWGIISTAELKGATTVQRVDSNAFIGIGRADDSVLPGFKFLSVND